MSKAQDTNPSQSSGAGRGVSPDAQALIGLLENLVPLLMQFQTRSLGQSGSLSSAGGQGVQLEQQAAVAFTEDVILDSLRNLSAYLQNNASRYPGLDSYTNVLSDAKGALAVRDYERALALVFEAYRAIAIMRAIRPELPPVRERASDEMGGAAAESVH
jgi:hypothetical protein